MTAEGGNTDETESGNSTPEAQAASFLTDKVIGYKIRRLHGLMQAGWTRWFSRFDLGLTPMQGGMLILVREHPGLTQTCLSAMLGIEPPTLSQAIAPLLRRGFLERRKVPGDKRAHALHVTRTGNEAADLIRREIPAHETAALAGLSPKEQQDLHRLLDKVIAAGADDSKIMAA